MYTRDDLEHLIRAARRAAHKMKLEYDLLVGPDVRLDECWAECEALWHELEAFEAEDARRDPAMIRADA